MEARVATVPMAQLVEKGGNLNLVFQNCGKLRVLLGRKLIVEIFGGIGGIGG